MGCECAKPRYYRAVNESELQVSEFEDLLGLSKHKSTAIWTQLQLSVSPPNLTHAEMLDFLTKLNLNREGFDSPVRPLNNFYGFFRRNNSWDQRKLALLGLVLGHGTSNEKVDIIYELYETEDLRASEMEKVFRDLLTIASIYLPSYAQYWMEAQNDHEKAEELIKYKEKLAVCIPDTVTTLSSLLISSSETEISREVFLVRMKGNIAMALFNARQLRILSLEVYKRNRKERQKQREVPNTEGKELVL